jgi:hypothetical protein
MYDEQLLSLERVPGWRGWLDMRESLLRALLHEREPWWARLYWKCRYLWAVTRCELVCRYLGHEWSYDRIGRYCLRCTKGAEEL